MRQRKVVSPIILNWDAAIQAGVLDEEISSDLAERYEQDRLRGKLETVTPAKPRERVTIATATQQQVIAALHKAMSRRKL